MKSVLALVALLLATNWVAAQDSSQIQDTQKQGDKTQEKKEDPKELTSKASYILGRNIADNFKTNGIELDAKALILGFQEVVDGKESKFTSAEIQKIMTDFDAYARKLVQKRAAEMADKNLRKGEEFLAKNAKKDGVIQLESGLQYQVIKAGTGAKPKSTDKVKVHYKGTFIDGTEFDSSIGGEPAIFGVGGVIKGFSEGIQNMPVGSKYRLFIPAKLGYQMQGPGKIGPNRMLIFEVELLDIVK